MSDGPPIWVPINGLALFANIAIAIANPNWRAICIGAAVLALVNLINYWTGKDTR